MWVRGHSRSLKIVPFESFDMVSYSPSIVTMAVSLAQGRFYVGARGAQAPQMLARPPPPNILVLTAKIRIVKI